MTKRENWIVTPHPGEAARLLGVSTSEIEEDRYRSVKQLQHLLGGVAILKGSGTVIKNSIDDIIKVCDQGNPGMATAGTGDVLCGVIAGLIAQNVTLEHAAESAVFFHGVAGDAVARNHGSRGMMATDLLPYIQKAVNFDPEIILGINPEEPKSDKFIEDEEYNEDFFNEEEPELIRH